jgi:hypothetical protein
MAKHLLPNYRVNSLPLNLKSSYCEGGELFYFVIQRKTLTEKETAMIMR